MGEIGSKFDSNDFCVAFKKCESHTMPSTDLCVCGSLSVAVPSPRKKNGGRVRLHERTEKLSRGLLQGYAPVSALLCLIGPIYTRDG